MAGSEDQKDGRSTNGVHGTNGSNGSNGTNGGYPSAARPVLPLVTAAATAAAALKVGEVRWRSQLDFFVNGRRVTVTDAEPHHTLLWFLRDRLGLTGTKLGCGEGGCGACTVTVAHFDAASKGVVYRAVNACLAPLCSVDGCSVTTVEGIGTTREPHPVQQRIAELHGSQCGFCTPGIVMALYSTLRRNPQPTLADIESAFDGNLCRCTGYRPILDAAKSFARDKEKCQKAPAGFEGVSENPEKEGGVKVCGSTSATLAALAAVPCEKLAKPPFPEALLTVSAPAPLRIAGSRVTWYRPSDLASLLALKREEPKAKLVAGNTEVGIEVKFKRMDYPVIISTAAVPELQEIGFDTSGALVIGGAVTLSCLEHFLEKALEHREAETSRWLKAILEMLRWFASSQIRNVAVLAGNIATASPISDLNPVLMTLGATLTLVAAGAAPREVPVREFFKSYRVVDMQPGEIICSIRVPPAASNFDFVRSFKQARRRDDDISIVNSCLRVQLTPNGDHWVVTKAHATFGGMAPTTIRAPKTEAALEGAKFNEATLESAYKILAKELALPEGVPGGMAAFRQALTLSFLYKFYVGVCLELADLAKKGGLPPAPTIAARDASAARSFLGEERPLSHGAFRFNIPSGGLQKSSVAGGQDHAAELAENRAPVGQPLSHRSALPQCTGEAEYVDDIPTTKDLLQGVLVMSERPHAKILSIDASAAEAVPGFVRLFTAKDLSPTENAIGPVLKDEELFRAEKVTSTGQPIGLVVAETLEAAERAAKLVKVEYEELPPVITIEDAIGAKSFHPAELMIQDGDIEKGFLEPDLVTVEGEIRIGGQEHFYLETNAALAVPGENDELTVHCSTQTPMKTQKFAAHVCGIPYSKVVCRVKRMGGGFGGKESRTVPFSSAVAFAAHRLKRPVRICLDRDIDMWATGTRHPFLGRYRAAARRDGKLVALDLQLYNNAGYSLDLSEPVMGRALFHSDNCYKIPNIRVQGKVCFTNTASNTAFRGFGGPQGMMICEAWIEHLATALKIRPEELRARNLHETDGDRAFLYQPLLKCPIRRMWSEISESAEFTHRVVEVQRFNAENRWRKRGISILPTKFGISYTATFMNQAGALVNIYTDGTVLVTHGGTEMGQGLHTKMIQVAARALGVPMQDVTIRDTTTSTVPNASPTAASASSDLYGMAILNACEQLMERLKPYLEKSGGNWKSAVNSAYFDRCDLSAHGFYKTPGISYDWKNPDASKRGTPFNYYTYGVAASEVEIDVLTGDLRILRADILMDVGNSLNPAIDVGQIEGAFAQGFGWSTMEETVWGCDEFPWLRPGACLTRGPGTYKIPSFNDVPIDLRVTLVKDSVNPKAIHSSRAIGEPPLFLGATAYCAAKEAIMSARADAGKAHEHFTVDLPLTAERIRLACGDHLVEPFLGLCSRGRASGFV